MPEYTLHLTEAPIKQDESLASTIAELYHSRIYWHSLGLNGLVSVRPHDDAPSDLFSTEMSGCYWAAGVHVTTKSPHLFTLGTQAFWNMRMRSLKRQTIRVVGESGSGKTEALKLLVQHQFRISAAGSSELLRNRLGSALFVIECLGSIASGSGSWSHTLLRPTATLLFNEGAHVVGAKLEVDRQPMPGLKRLPAFHALAEQPENNPLFATLGIGYSFRLLQGAADEVRIWSDWVVALRQLKLSAQQQRLVNQILAGILVLGNVEMETNVSGAVTTKDSVHWRAAALLLGVQMERLEAMLTSIPQPDGSFLLISADSVMERLSQLTIFLYDKLVAWMTAHCNSVLRGNQPIFATISFADSFEGPSGGELVNKDFDSLLEDSSFSFLLWNDVQSDSAEKEESFDLFVYCIGVYSKSTEDVLPQIFRQLAAHNIAEKAQQLSCFPWEGRFGNFFDCFPLDTPSDDPSFTLLALGCKEFKVERDFSVFLSHSTIRTLHQQIAVSSGRQLQTSTTASFESEPELQDECVPASFQLDSVDHYVQKTSLPIVDSTRRKWLFVVRMLTGWLPDRVIEVAGKISDEATLQAWREKFALCIIIALLSTAMICYVTVFTKLLCPTQQVMTWQEVRSCTAADPHVVIFGKVYDLTPLRQTNRAIQLTNKNGQDLSSVFSFAPRCSWPSGALPWKAKSGGQSPSDLKAYRVAELGFNADEILAFDRKDNARIVVNGRVYNVSKMIGKKLSDRPQLQRILSSQPYGVDRTFDFSYAGAKGDLACLEDVFEGVIDGRNSFRCRFSEWLLIGSTGLIVLVMVAKFFAAIRVPSARSPEPESRWVVCQVPCYTEGEESLRKTLESLALTDYPDSRKLLFVVCDGMLIGSGNDRPTARIVLDLLGVPPDFPEPIAFSYPAIGPSGRHLNRARVYSGWFNCREHRVPFLVVCKVGMDGERLKPGNRGKRDSQMILLNFFRHFFESTPMVPVELEIARQLTECLGIDPMAYEFLLQVDADTEVLPDSLTALISNAAHDTNVIGLCGETEIGNEKQSLVTMIQVYEYFISHHLAKAFESLFGSVTCLPGCFSLYRLRYGKQLFIVSGEILDHYGENVANETLHTKNLLHLGEDRFLTTLLIKSFPRHKLCFTSEAKCRTIVPDSWSVLVSQRRRWINSTIHNLFELLLVDQLCGFCLFGMRFVVLIDLFATLVMPATVVYLIVLIVQSCLKQTVPLVSLIMLSLAYGMQAVIFMIRGQWQHIGWMVLNFLAMPIFNFCLPLYAYWHFDDFGWGSTRRVIVDSEGHTKEEPEHTMPHLTCADLPKQTWLDFQRGIVKSSAISQ